MRFLSLFLLSFTLAFATTQTGFSFEESNTSEVPTSPTTLASKVSTDLNESLGTLEEETLVVEPEIQAKLLYQSYFKPPKKLFKGQIFTLTIKTLLAKKNFDDLKYEFSNTLGLSLISEEYSRRQEAPYFYDTFYFQVKSSRVKTPHVTTSLLFNDYSDILKDELNGIRIDTVNLNPEKDFSGILADTFKITEYKTTQYDNQSNIVVFSAEAKMGNLQDFSLNIAKKENIDSYEATLPYSKITYYAVVSKQLDELKFTYFNLKTRRFQNVIVPIIVHNDRVSTQTDLAPTQNMHVTPKLIAFSIVALLGLALYIYRRNKFFLLIFIIPLFFIAQLLVPKKQVCIQADSNIYLLPMLNGTVFEQVPYRFTTEALGESKDFTKIRMQNKQIGWVKDDNLCKN